MELRAAVRRDRISWYPEDIFLVGLDGPMEERTTKEGALVLWADDDGWRTAYVRSGRLDREPGWAFEGEADACRWAYDLAYLDKYQGLGEEALIHLYNAGPTEAAAGVRAELRNMGELRAELLSEMRRSGHVGREFVDPALRDLGAEANCAQLRQTISGWPGFNRDASWNPNIRPVDAGAPVGGWGDGTTNLWCEDGRWLVGRQEHGASNPIFAFETEAEACRWVYDEAYFYRFRSAGPHIADHLERFGDRRTAALVREEWAAMEIAAKRNQDAAPPYRRD